MDAVDAPARDGRGRSGRRIVALDAGWDVLLGIGCLTVAVPGGAHTLGLPPVGWPVQVALVVVGLGSLGYGGLLAHAARDEQAAAAICRPTAIANAVAAGMLAAVTVLMSGALGPLGTAVLLIAALGCATFAGAEGPGVPRQ